jgi:hypothetical protein
MSVAIVVVACARSVRELQEAERLVRAVPRTPTPEDASPPASTASAA